MTIAHNLKHVALLSDFCWYTALHAFKNVLTTQYPVKMKTRHPVGDHLAESFRLLQSLRSYDGLSRKNWKCLSNFCIFLKKRPLMVP